MVGVVCQILKKNMLCCVFLSIQIMLSEHCNFFDGQVMILEKSGDGWWRGQYGNKVREQIQNWNLTLTSSLPGWVVPLKLHPGGDRWPPHLLHGRERSRRHGTIPYSPFGSYEAMNFPPPVVWKIQGEGYCPIKFTLEFTSRRIFPH